MLTQHTVLLLLGGVMGSLKHTASWVSLSRQMIRTVLWGPHDAQMIVSRALATSATISSEDLCVGLSNDQQVSWSALKSREPTDAAVNQQWGLRNAEKCAHPWERSHVHVCPAFFFSYISLTFPAPSSPGTSGGGISFSLCNKETQESSPQKKNKTKPKFSSD